MSSIEKLRKIDLKDIITILTILTSQEARLPESRYLDPITYFKLHLLVVSQLLSN